MNSLKMFLTLGVFAFLLIIAKCAVSNEEEAVLTKLGLTERKLTQTVDREWSNAEVKLWYEVLVELNDKERRVFLAMLEKVVDSHIALKLFGLTMKDLVKAVKTLGVEKFEKLLEAHKEYDLMEFELRMWWDDTLQLLNGTVKMANGTKVDLYKHVQSELMNPSVTELWDFLRWEEHFEKKIEQAVEVVKAAERAAKLAEERHAAQREKAWEDYEEWATLHFDNKGPM